MSAFEADHDAAAAIKEIQAYFGIELSENTAPAPTPDPDPNDDGYDESPETWMQRA